MPHALRHNRRHPSGHLPDRAFRWIRAAEDQQREDRNDGKTPKTVKATATQSNDDSKVEFDAVVCIDTPGEPTTTATAASSGTC